MISAESKSILRHHIAAKSQRRVAKELGVSPTTISLVLADKYGASTEAIETRIKGFYGQSGQVNCPVLGEISPARCAENRQRAQVIRTAGNPATIRLFAECRKCKLLGNN